MGCKATDGAGIAVIRHHVVEGVVEVVIRCLLAEIVAVVAVGQQLAQARPRAAGLAEIGKRHQLRVPDGGRVLTVAEGQCGVGIRVER